MVNPALMKQVDELGSEELEELRDAIDAKLEPGLSEAYWSELGRRVAEADANPDDYITLEQWKQQRRTRRGV